MWVFVMVFGIGGVRGVGTVACGGVLIRAVGIGVLYGVCELGSVKRVFLVDIIIRTVVVGIVDLCLLGRVHVGLMVAVIGIVVGGVGVVVIVRWS